MAACFNQHAALTLRAEEESRILHMCLDHGGDFGKAFELKAQHDVRATAGCRHKRKYLFNNSPRRLNHTACVSTHLHDVKQAGSIHALLDGGDD
eukprot:4318953-Pleurochrysis_carterae.AAC.1